MPGKQQGEEGTEHHQSIYDEIIEVVVEILFGVGIDTGGDGAGYQQHDASCSSDTNQQAEPGSTDGKDGQ